jgi:hypothetical protein
MSIELLGLQILAYSFALWLGLYLFARNPAKPLLRLAGLGLLAYALSLAFGVLRDRAPTPSLAADLARLQWVLSFLPALFWSGALFWLVPESKPLRMRLARVWSYGLVPATAVFCWLAITGNWILDFTPDALRAGPGYLIFAAVVIVPLLAGFVLTLHFFKTIRPKQPVGLIIAATLFFGLGVGLLIFPLGWLPHEWVVVAIGVDLALLGVAVAVLDAFDEGETLLPDIARSLAASSFIVVLFGGQVALAIAMGEGLTFPLLALLLAIIAAAIGVQVFSDWIQSALDRLVFARSPRLQQARSDLRAATSALPRMSEALDPNTLDDAEFTRLTRRAISHLGDLPRLTTSPLTRLSIVQDRLAARSAHDDALERATELKALLTESIVRLKPRDKGDFGTSDEWRHYNALYFPYVVGLKPYSRRADQNGLDPIVRQALDWFRSNVPERTLYNWQNAAAKLVAQELRQRDRLT